MSTYLGLDYGKVHIGVALAEGSLSSPLTTLPNNATLTANILRLVEEHKVTQVVVGEPEGPLASVVQDFTSHLESKLGVPVALHPETLSTHVAVAALRATGASRQKLKDDHQYAACLILDDYLDMLN